MRVLSPPASPVRPGASARAPAAPAAPANGAPPHVLLLAPIFAALASLALGLRFLARAHPNEDAFILFKYAENIARGAGYVYYPGGPHAEGATDFLFLLVLAGLRRLGVDVAIGACLLNAVGAWLASFLVCQAVRRSTVRGAAAIGLALLGFAPVLMDGTVAGYFGFSATIYSAAALLLACTATCARGRAIAWTPLLAVAVGLIRPDGVVLGAGFTLLALVRARRTPGALSRCLLAGLGALAIGGAYLAWRRWYFGLALPLPLYVKGWGAVDRNLLEAAVHGVRSAIGWLSLRTCPLPMVLGALVLAAIASRREPRRLLPLAAAAAVYFVHLAVLVQATLTQNIASRFQAPELVALVFALAWLGLRAWEAAEGSGLRPMLRAAALLVPLAAVAPAVAIGARVLRVYESTHTYVETFAPELGAILRKDRVFVLTEAGRLCFWTDARVEDAGGLDTPYTALHPANLEWVRSVSPDVVLFHTGSVLLHGALADVREDVIRIDPEVFERCVMPDWIEVYRNGLARYSAARQPGDAASVLLARFLAKTPGYDVYAVRYAGEFRHVWAWRSGLEEGPAILAALEATASGARPYRSYLQVSRANAAD